MDGHTYLLKLSGEMLQQAEQTILAQQQRIAELEAQIGAGVGAPETSTDPT